MKVLLLLQNQVRIKNYCRSVIVECLLACNAYQICIVFFLNELVLILAFKDLNISSENKVKIYSCTLFRLACDKYSVQGISRKLLSKCSGTFVFLTTHSTSGLREDKRGHEKWSSQQNSTFWDFTPRLNISTENRKTCSQFPSWEEKQPLSSDRGTAEVAETGTRRSLWLFWIQKKSVCFYFPPGWRPNHVSRACSPQPNKMQDEFVTQVRHLNNELQFFSSLWLQKDKRFATMFLLVFMCTSARLSVSKVSHKPLNGF